MDYLNIHADKPWHNYSGDFLPISRGRISAPFPIENSHLFSQYHVCFSQLRKVKKIFFFTFFRDHYYSWETMTHIRMIVKHLCLSGTLDIIQSKITWFWGYILLSLFYVVNFSQFWCLSRSFFPNFGLGPFPKIAGKSPVITYLSSWRRHIQF